MEAKRGFTLIELIIAMAVSSILVLGLIYVLSTILKAEKVQDEFVRAQEAVRITSLAIEKDIRQSSQQLEVRHEGNCTYVDDTKTLVSQAYCINDHFLEHNGVVLSNNIEFFEIEKENMRISIVVRSKFREDIIVYEKTIFLR